ncbi:hypothetical protein ACH5RR_035804 [Cinchona calisaya]|uniref:Pyrrolo-quinoline quinone n=1 Tax=Cinchona calisaya TaxID=153742 RepID=A0ABD2Y6B5_9GENT
MAQRNSFGKNNRNLFVLLLKTIYLIVLVDSTVAEMLNHGGDQTNRRNAVGELLINPTPVRPAVVIAVKRLNGQLVWLSHLDPRPLARAGPGSIQGRGIWGAATDGQRVYTNIVNGDRLPFILAPSAETTTAGAWVAMDANTGEVLWSTANPSNET